MFASALTTGDFMSETIESTDAAARYHLLQAMFAAYLCCATIILLNILITMMNNRYEEVRKKAQNMWRFQIIHTWIQLSVFFGFTQAKVLKGLRFYWKVVDTTYDKVTISEDCKAVLLHLKHHDAIAD